jgi:hypothetical protein
MLGLAATIVSAAAAIAAPAPVQALALDPRVVAYASAHSAADCDRVRVWSRATRRTVRLGRATSCEQTSTGSGIAALSVARTRVLWLHYAGGNIREWSLFTATTTAPRPRRLRFAARDVDAPAPIVLGEGDSTRFGELLPYAVERELVVLRPNGSRAFAWTAPAPVTAVGAKWGGVAVALEDGRVVVLEDGVVTDERRLPAAARAVFVTGNGIVAQLPREAYLVSGPNVFRRPLPADARVRDADAVRAVYLTRGRAKLLELRTGRTRDLGRATDVQLEGATFAVASGRSIRLLRVA